MADLMQSAVEWVRDMQAQHTAQTITYTRSGQSISISATIGQQVFRNNNPTSRGPYITRADAVFIFDPTSLDFGSGQVDPDRGDRITWNGNTYELYYPEGEDAWRPCDGYRKQIRVNTLKVS